MNKIDLFEFIAKYLKNADAVAIFAGAGMSVDSGLEQYRGDDGLWTKSIILNNKTVNYYDLMKPAAFREEPELAWGLIGDRMKKYGSAEPHEGYTILKEMVIQKEYFIITSNIDEHFQKAGFDAKRILEFHGSIFNTQCMYNIECGIWETPNIRFDPIDMITTSQIPMCPVCNSYCRPNIHLFDDDFFVPTISAEQQFRYMEWREKINLNCKNILAIEIGAGKTLPIIRNYAERFAGENNPLIRINLNDHETNQTNHISVPFGAKDTFVRIRESLNDCPF